MPPPTLQSVTLDLLLRVNRLLDEADQVRALRDRLMEVAQHTSPAKTRPASEQKEVGHAG